MATCMANANRELRHNKEHFTYSAAVALAYSMFRGVFESADERVANVLRMLREDGRPASKEFQCALPQLVIERGRVRMQRAWDTWFPPQLQASNPSYIFDFRIVEQ